MISVSSVEKGGFNQPLKTGGDVIRYYVVNEDLGRSGADR
jgi:hypothetical protein